MPGGRSAGRPSAGRSSRSNSVPPRWEGSSRPGWKTSRSTRPPRCPRRAETRPIRPRERSVCLLVSWRPLAGPIRVVADVGYQLRTLALWARRVALDVRGARHRQCSTAFSVKAGAAGLFQVPRDEAALQHHVLHASEDGLAVLRVRRLVGKVDDDARPREEAEESLRRWVKPVALVDGQPARPPSEASEPLPEPGEVRPVGDVRKPEDQPTALREKLQAVTANHNLGDVGQPVDRAGDN